jgi:hypothetical protein
MFARPDANSTGYIASLAWPRVTLSGSTSIAITNSSQVDIGTYTRESGQIGDLLTNTATPTTVQNRNIEPLEVNSSFVSAFSMDYSIVRGNSIRKGVLTVVSSSGSNPLTYSDDYTENADTGIILSVSESLFTISVKYTSTNTVNNAIITYSLTYF